MQFLEKFSANNFALSDAEDNTSWPLNRGGIAYANLVASRNLLQRLLACLNLTLESENLSLWYKRKK